MRAVTWRIIKATTNPNHQQAGFSTDCETCHGAAAGSWQGATFDHSLVFPLSGQHAVTDCALCHPNGQYTGTPSTCAGCHLADYQGTTNPNHQQAGFSTDCETCHGAAAGSWQGATFDHSLVFPLSGQHAVTDCALCHPNGQYTGTPSTCAGCHLADYQATTNPNHQQAGFSTDCATCHGAAAGSWQGATFDHSLVFPLSGQHAVTDCALCHPNGQYTGTPSTCAGCHLADYQGTTNPNHQQAGFSTDCETCHGAAAGSWQGATFDHSLVFPLSGQHAVTDCALCHPNGQYTGTPSTCAGCHLADYQATTNPNHQQAGFSTDCATCHGAAASSWQGATFDHSLVFPLSGQHAVTDCALCHPNGQYTGTPSTCAGCHLADYQATTNPNHQQAGFSTDCETCHGAAAGSWQGATFDHSLVFPLSGQHAVTDCALCHPNGQYTGTPSTCASCHLSNYQATTNPNHQQAGFSTDCETCHGAAAGSWQGATFDHNLVWPLSGQHQVVDCAQCHPNGQYTGTPSTCASCHLSDYQATTNPNHQQAGFSTDCETCHGLSATSWLGATFDHNLVWPLSGQHQVVDCAQCHPNGQYTGTPSTCASCHLSDYQATTNPNHQQAGFSTDCETCHGLSATSWLGATFDHNLVWPLSGQHQVVDCAQCHPNGQYTGTPSTCASCHLSDYQATTNPNHQQAGFSTDCETCHGLSATSWLGATFDHNLVWPLSGQHQVVDCAQCHPNGQYTGTPSTCASCHLSDYQATTNPNHQQAGFSTDCETCHGLSATSWLGATFDHNLVWPLSGQHQVVDCAQCHPNGQYTGTPSTCASCHLSDYQATTNPNHQQAGFSTDCETCHGLSATSWLGATFDHNLVWPLSGQHQVVDCAQCHPNGQYTGTPSTCASCHLSDYQATTNPNHQQAGFSTDCETCHGLSATSWLGATFDHNLVWPLSGQHQVVDCAQCHPNGQYTGTPSTCASCHLSDYQATTNPNHQQAGFSTDCETCHGLSATSWLGATFDHNLVWPLSGQHQVVDCAQCHPNGQYTGTPSTCASCHLSDYQATTNPNHQQAGFSTDCETCHGTSANSWQGATFDHNLVWPLNGQHQVVDCALCHPNGQYTGTASNCESCHRADYQSTTNPNHQQAGFSTDCETCHGTSANSWQGATFDHNLVWALNGQHRVADCALCHPNGQYTGTASNCESCHLADYQSTTNPNHQQAGFSTDCQSCHGTAANAWLGATFNHDQVWPLQGAHSNLDCQICHSQGYNLPQDCYGCHASDYNSAVDPNHTGAGFPTTCETCHFPNHVAWTQAQFNHNFPINSGPHAPNSCSDCHLTSNYQDFSCIDCHKHEQPNMDEKHSSVGGYSYNSQACYSCHPNGRH